MKKILALAYLASLFFAEALNAADSYSTKELETLYFDNSTDSNKPLLSVLTRKNHKPLVDEAQRLQDDILYAITYTLRDRAAALRYLDNYKVLSVHDLLKAQESTLKQLIPGTREAENFKLIKNDPRIKQVIEDINKLTGKTLLGESTLSKALNELLTLEEQKRVLATYLDHLKTYVELKYSPSASDKNQAASLLEVLKARLGQSKGVKHFWEQLLEDPTSFASVLTKESGLPQGAVFNSQALTQASDSLGVLSLIMNKG